jgi:hypothetical protein
MMYRGMKEGFWIGRWWRRERGIVYIVFEGVNGRYRFRWQGARAARILL